MAKEETLGSSLMMKSPSEILHLLKQSLMVTLKIFRRRHLSSPKIKYTTEGTAATLRKRQTITALQDNQGSSHLLSRLIKCFAQTRSPSLYFLGAQQVYL